MTYLFRPDNGRMAAFVDRQRGYVCLRTDQITPAVTWYPLAKVIAHNSAQAVQDAKPERAPFMTEMLFTCAEPPPIQGCALPPVLAVSLTPDLAANVSHAIGCEVKIVPPVSLFHEAMRGAA